MAEEKEKKSLVKKARNGLILMLIIFAAGFALGYYVAYDIGFEKAARILMK